MTAKNKFCKCYSIGFSEHKPIKPIDHSINKQREFQSQYDCTCIA